MEKQIIHRLVKKLNFNAKLDQLSFERDVLSLFENDSMKSLVRKNTIQVLKDLYLSLTGVQSTFQIALSEGIKKEEPNYLLPFFEKLFKDEDPRIIKVNALEVFILLCSKIVDQDYLMRFLKSGILQEYSLDRIQSLKYFYLPNLETLIQVYDENKNNFSSRQLLLAFDILKLLYPTTLDKESGTHLAFFINKIAPVFIARFETQISEKELLDKVDRFAEWFMIWRRHYLKLEENIDGDHDYYKQDFETIIKYIPEFIWWNNGLYYANGDKNYHFGSDGFYHLATGGSIRKAPDRHHFTRRMAKVFVTLPFDFEQQGKDMYVYCYGKSLGAGPLLLDMLQQFMRHSPNHIELEEELEKWNPIIQKLSCETFEELGQEAAIPFMGFLYHCMRDKPDFTVQRRTVDALLRESEAYNERLQQRVNQRAEAQRLRALRMEKKRKEEIAYWSAHGMIKPFEYQDYVIVELLTKNALEQEGNILNHCVGSYFKKCKNKVSSIWSLRRFENKKTFRCVTIEIFNKTQEIIQMSARFNSTPNKEHKQIIESWAKREKIRGFLF